MDTQVILPRNLEERVVWRAIRATYAFYALGALYVVAPVLGWCLILLWFARLAFGEREYQVSHPVPVATRLWMAGMLVMLVALLVAHLDFELGLAQTVKSSIGWAKGWALIALFALLGCLDVRAELVYRACMHVCLHTLLLLPLFVGAWLGGLPQTAYVSPLQIVGGPGPEFFALSLYEIDPGSGRPRWRLFAPWAPALGFVANIFFVFALRDRDRRWRAIGIGGSIAMILMSGSRLAAVALVFVTVASWVASRPRSVFAFFHAAAATTLGGLVAVPALDALEHFWQAFRAARAGSTRVRETLGRIALDRWLDEAPIWGHGIVERGPHLVEFMAIGSHHSWLGLLFVKGIVGALALAIPLLWSLLQLGRWSCRLATARAGFAVALLLVLYTFGENLEVLAYLIWPGLLVMGIAHRDVAITAARLPVDTETPVEKSRHA